MKLAIALAAAIGVLVFATFRLATIVGCPPERAATGAAVMVSPGPGESVCCQGHKCWAQAPVVIDGHEYACTPL